MSLCDRSLYTEQVATVSLICGWEQDSDWRCLLLRASNEQKDSFSKAIWKGHGTVIGTNGQQVQVKVAFFTS